MQHSEGTFTSTDGLSIFHQAWTPDASPRSVVLVVHGLAEHSGRYAALAESLTGAGHAVHALDHRGHGRSDGKRVFVRSYAEYMDDLARIRRLVEERHPGLPLVVLGHSMGGNLAVGHVLDHQDGVRGLALSAPALVPGSDLSPLKLRAAKLIAKVAPGLPAERLPADAISRDPAVVSAYRNDPLVYTGKVTAGLGAALIDAMQRFPARYAEFRIPILLQHGTADRLVEVAGTRQLEAGAVNATVTSHYYDGLFHEVFNEPERDTVIADLLAWLDSVTAD